MTEVGRFSPRKENKSRTYCSVFNCSSMSCKDLDVRFHLFPKPGESFVDVFNKFGATEKVDKLQTWIRALKIGKKVSKSMRVCSLHFKRDDYLLPDISGISSVSRSTSIRGPMRADHSMESSSQTNLTGRLAKGSINAGKRGSSQLEEVNKAFVQCENTIIDYAVKKLIYECVKEASLNTDEALTKSTAKKLEKLLTVHNVEKYLHIPNNSNDINEKMTLLGITDLPKTELNYEEKLEIKRLVEKKLRKKTELFLARFKELGGNCEELTKKKDVSARQQICEIFEPDLYEWREKIEQECKEYEKDILEYKKYFSEWTNLKYVDMNNIQLKKAESLLIKVQVSEAQAKITKCHCILKMFKDAPFTLEAYRTISSSLDDKISQMENEIKKKKAMIKLYEDLRGTEYDQIAQKYSELCEAIKRKKRIMADMS